MSKKIVVATTNPGKIAEFSAMLDLDVQWLGLTDFENIEEVPETGQTFEENAQIKALGYAKQTGLWTLADDSGLEIDALDGLPGVRSARFSGEKSDKRTLHDHANMEKVLKLMETVPDEKRTARFVCCLCLAGPEKVILEQKGTLEGIIAKEKIGSHGFGYDPIFWVPDMQKTAAQLEPEQKNAISHRGNAIRKLKPSLIELLNNEKGK